ncbi:uncharacterized protein LOC143177341 [Calliopsis andreniformis]|uniref:uncharacterized protein LOC143177341 n=1 Tax=Calliopsis andreniformis TaxID=337506 RepID=UPI003FCDC269
MTYLGLHIITQYWDLGDWMGHMEMVVLNIMETALTTAIYMGLILVRCSKHFKDMVINMRREVIEKPFYKNVEEKRLYSIYNNVAYLFNKYAAAMAMSTVYMMYFRPLIPLLLSIRGNETAAYELPFRNHIIVDYSNNVGIFVFLYLYQFPFTYVAVYHVGQVSFVGNFVLHLCGKLSILSYRIRNIQTTSSQTFRNGVKQIVVMHLELSNEVGDAFYDVNWPTVKSNDRKALLICMINGQKTMYIAAGRFYVLSLFGFSSIVKTSMACLSMLRANI